MMRIPTHTIRGFLARHKTVLLRAGVGFIGVLMLVQIFYPGSAMPPFAKVDGVSVGGMSKESAIKRLNKLSEQQKIVVALGNLDKNYASVKPVEIGLEVLHNKRIESSNYPWYLRIIPTSLFWFGPLQAEKPAEYASNSERARQFLDDRLGNSCSIPAKDATLKQAGEKLVVVQAKDGGVCKQAEALAVLKNAKPVLNQVALATIPVDILHPKVGNKAADEMAKTLNSRVKNGVEIDVVGEKQTIIQKEVLSWLTFASDGEKLTFAINPEKANEYLAKTAAQKVTKPAGVTRVSTLDFIETSRANGLAGQTLGLEQTTQSIRDVIDGKSKNAAVIVVPLAPKVEYTRSYTKTNMGIAALMQHYAEDHAGTFGISFVELGGRGLNASYNANKSFITASTYKLFVAYSVLMRVEKGEWKWSDDVTGGRNLSACFDDMIVKSDNACAEAMYKKMGYQTVINEARALGLPNTTLAGDGQRTSAGDLVTFLTKLENKTIGLKDESRGKLLEAMKRNVYRQGIPAGASGTVADKVGFLNGLLHDASIVYSPKGTYVLTVMTDGSMWGNIAELTRKIEELR